jgi:hypothetical protein
MLVFIDESGDPGLKLDSGSSEHFTVTMVVFEDNDEAQAADDRITRLRSELWFRPDSEFKFNKLSRAHRERFLRELISYDFFYLSIVINKARLNGPGFKFKESFYKYACSLVFENAKPYLTDATVVIDGSGSKEFKRQLATYLRKRVNEEKSNCRHIKKIKLQDSTSNNLLQLADMVCGAVAKSYKKDAPDGGVYRKIISAREISVRFWPR